MAKPLNFYPGVNVRAEWHLPFQKEKHINFPDVKLRLFKVILVTFEQVILCKMHSATIQLSYSYSQLDAKDNVLFKDTFIRLIWMMTKDGPELHYR